MAASPPPEPATGLAPAAPEPAEPPAAAPDPHEALEARLAALEARLGHAFGDRGLLVQALRHASSKSEAAPSNERLEFLGDSVLGVIVARTLYDAHPEWDEGELTRVKSAVVCAGALAEAAAGLEIAPHIALGKGMSNQERLPPSLLANVFEAIVAAIYLDGGLAAAERFVLLHLGGKIGAVAAEESERNWKSILQQYAQRAFAVTPTYRVTAESGPEHAKRFEVAAWLGERGEAGRGEGRSKKEAEQRAAEAALRALLGERFDAAREGDIAPVLPAAAVEPAAPPPPPA